MSENYRLPGIYIDGPVTPPPPPPEPTSIVEVWTNIEVEVNGEARPSRAYGRIVDEILYEYCILTSDQIAAMGNPENIRVTMEPLR